MSRREALRFGTSLGVIRCLATAAPTQDDTPVLSIIGTLPKATLRSISPDGKLLCVEDWSEKGYPLKVLELDTLSLIYTRRFASRTLRAAFMADGRRLFVRCFGPTSKNQCVVGKGGCAVAEFVLVDIETGDQAIHTTPLPVGGGGNYYDPLRGETLLDIHYANWPYRTETLSLVELPDYRTRLTVPYATNARKLKMGSNPSSQSTEYGLSISPDRDKLIYAFDDTVVCRRAEDLSVMWTRRIPQGLHPFGLCFSPNANRVAAAVADNALSYLQRTSFVAIYDGLDGQEVTQLPQSGTSGLALSPDGTLAAIVRLASRSNGDVELTAEVRDVESGRLIASAPHDRVKAGRRQLLESACGVAFSPGGKYLITSGKTTKVWRFTYDGF